MVTPTRLTVKVLNELSSIGRTKSLVVDYSGLVSARQLVYNRQKTYPGCIIDTSMAPEIVGNPGYYSLMIKRVAFGSRADGTPEPKTNSHV